VWIDVNVDMNVNVGVLMMIVAKMYVHAYHTWKIHVPSCCTLKNMFSYVHSMKYFYFIGRAAARRAAPKLPRVIRVGPIA